MGERINPRIEDKTNNEGRKKRASVSKRKKEHDKQKRRETRKKQWIRLDKKENGPGSAEDPIRQTLLTERKRLLGFH